MKLRLHTLAFIPAALALTSGCAEKEHSLANSAHGTTAVDYQKTVTIACGDNTVAVTKDFSDPRNFQDLGKAVCQQITQQRTLSNVLGYPVQAISYVGYRDAHHVKHRMHVIGVVVGGTVPRPLDMNIAAGPALQPKAG